MLQGFKQFILRGNVLDLAVAVVMGVAFGAVVAALVKDFITPLIAAIVGKPDFSAIEFTINGSRFPIGDFINSVVSFILIAAAVYFFHRAADEHASRTDAARRGGSRPDHQKMPGMPKRCTNCGTPLCVLHLPARRSRQALRSVPGFVLASRLPPLAMAAILGSWAMNEAARAPDELASCRSKRRPAPAGHTPCSSEGSRTPSSRKLLSLTPTYRPPPAVEHPARHRPAALEW